MVLLQAIVEIVIRPMQHVIAQGLTDRTGIGIMPIGRHPLWGVADDVDSLLEKALGCLHISLLAEHRINQIAISIDGSIEIAPFSFDVDVGLINIPGSPCLSTSFGTQLVCHEWSKARFPVPDCLMGELKAALQKHFSQVTQAQLVPQAPENDEQNDIGRVLQKVEGSGSRVH